MSESHKGKTHSDITLAKLSEAKKGENHPLFGKLHSAETKALMRKAKLGKFLLCLEKRVKITQLVKEFLFLD